MITKKIEELSENPNNLKDQNDDGFDRLVRQMKMGDHSTFLITPAGMVIDGNHRLKAAKEAGWTEVQCRVLSYEKTDDGYSAVIDDIPVRNSDGGVPFYYDSPEAMYLAYALSRNGSAAYYSEDKFANSLLPETLDLTLFDANFFPPKSIEDTLKQIESNKKFNLIINCADEAEQEAKYNDLVEKGYKVKRT